MAYILVFNLHDPLESILIFVTDDRQMTDGRLNCQTKL